MTASVRISELRLPVGHSDADLRQAVLGVLGAPASAVASMEIVKRSADARTREGVRFNYIVDVTLADPKAWLQRVLGRPKVAPAPDKTYAFDFAKPATSFETRPIIVGAGPCGFFCGLALARAGARPIILERGKAVEQRARDTMGFWRDGSRFNPESNVQFGEGGAGTFSDGKLYTQIKDKENRLPWILREMVAHGAPADILVKARPHVGTDKLGGMVSRIRETITSLGGEYRFETRVADLLTDADGRCRGVRLADGTELRSDCVVLAVGHSSRDSFEMLHRHGVSLEQKPFSMGVRIEHPQRLIDKARWGVHAGHPALGAADYKFVHHCRNGRTAYSFCMCPGGLVVASASEPGALVTNGMSGYSRNEANANSGFMVEVRPEDFGSPHPLAGIEFQRKWERAAFELGGSNYHAPAQKVGDFLAGRPSSGPGTVAPSYRPGVTWTDLSRCLPDFVTRSLREAIPAIEEQIPGFSMHDAVLTAIETRSSSPVRVPRGEDLQSISTPGLYPAGEGAGYAGGIISAAVDGLRIAEAIVTTARTLV